MSRLPTIIFSVARKCRVALDAPAESVSPGFDTGAYAERLSSACAMTLVVVSIAAVMSMMIMILVPVVRAVLIVVVVVVVLVIPPSVPRLIFL